MNLMYDVLDETCSILFATHLTEELEQYADGITMLSKGRQIFSHTMPELEERYKIVRGTSIQMDALKERLIARRKMEHYEEGLIEESGGRLQEELSVSRPALADLLYYLDGKF